MINVHGDESGFVKNCMEASGTREGIQDKLEVPDHGGVPFDQDKRVIRIMEDRAAEAVHEGMTDVAVGGRFLEESLQDIGDDNKEVRGNRVAITKASAALEPAPRHASEKDGRLARSERVGNPGAPPVTETPRAKDEIEAVPGNRVKSLFEVKLQDDSGCMALVTVAEKVSGVYEIFSNVPAMDEPRLVGVNQMWNVRPETVGEHFGH